MPGQTILEIPAPVQEQMLAELRSMRYGYFLGLHILLLCAAGKTPSEIADSLFCSRSSVYRTVTAYRQGQFGVLGSAGGEDQEGKAAALPVLSSLKRSLRSIVKQAPQRLGWCRTRWSCATLALELKARRGATISREKVRRWLHEIGDEWKRARHAARDDDPERETKLARIRHLCEHLGLGERLFFVDELNIHLLPKLGSEWMKKGTQREVWRPGQNEKRYLAGALNVVSGKLLHVLGERKNRFLFLDLLKKLDQACAADTVSKLYLVADTYKIHKAKVVVEWLAAHPRFEIVWLPSYCPKANPIERAFGDVHDKCTRNHRRQRIREVVGDVVWHLRVNGPWRYKLSEEVHHTEAINQAVARLEKAGKAKAA